MDERLEYSPYLPPQKYDVCAGFGVNCTNFWGVWYRQRTQYDDERQNWVCMCDECRDENDYYWDEKWREYYSGRI